MKNKMYRRKMDTVEEVLGHIMAFIIRMKERQDTLGQATRYVLIRVAKCIDIDGGIFENILC
jgi:hypothetical protein